MLKIKEYDRIRLKDGRIGTVVAGAPNGPYSVDIGNSPDTWDNIFVDQNEIEKVLPFSGDMLIDNLFCPALNQDIDFGYCQELQMATDNAIVWDGLEDRFSEQQMTKCKKCKKRIDPAID